jgi:hypothetical protein
MTTRRPKRLSEILPDPADRDAVVKWILDQDDCEREHLMRRRQKLDVWSLPDHVLDGLLIRKLYELDEPGLLALDKELLEGDVKATQRSSRNHRLHSTTVISASRSSWTETA